MNNIPQRNARWYYLSALAHNGLGNQVTALEHMKRAVSMDPSNLEYLRALQAMENGGNVYRQQSEVYKTSCLGNPCCTCFMCWFFNACCCPC